MFLKMKNVLIFLLVAIIAWIGWKTYSYFFDTNIPTIKLSGLEDGNYYDGDVQCIISVNKGGYISAWLDNKPLLSNFKVGTANREHPFSIPTRTVSNGKHTIKISFMDDTFRKNQTNLNRDFYVDNIPLQAAFVRPETDYKVLQGRTLHLQFQVNKKIESATANTLSSQYPCFPETKNSSIYETFIPVPCEETPNEYLVNIDIKDRVGNTLKLENKFQVIQYPFKKTTLKVDKNKIEEEKELGKNAEIFEQMMEEAVQKSPQEKYWRGAFCTPIEIVRTTCEFGTIRTTQEKGKYQHKAVDIINSPKSVVWASQSGVIAIKDRFVHSGNTVVIDHGWGVFSMYFHLDDFANIEVGKKIAQGNPVGTIGETGYAKGYHLHWEIRVNNTAVDPIQWTKQSF